MKRHAVLKTWLPIAIAALIAALAFATGRLDKQQTWVEMAYQYFDFPSGASLTSQDGSGYGVMNTGPGFNLPAGTYRLRWIIEGDGENRILLSAANGARITPSVLKTSPEQRTDEAEFTILDAADGFSIQTEFADGTFIDVIDFRLYSPMYRDHAFSLALVLAAACALWIAHRRGYLTPERRAHLLIIGFAVLLASTPSLKDDLTFSTDMSFHMARLENLKDALLSGQFPARVGGFSYNGYGAATSVFYPDVFLYPFALLLAAGASIQYAIHLYEIATHLSAAAAMYVCAKRIFGDRNTAVCASVLYTLAIYRVMDIYVRGALGEAAAMSLLPLFVLGLWEVVFGDKSRWRLLAVSAVGICLCHVLSTLMCAAFALGVFALFFVRIVRERRLPALMKAGCTAALLCAFWLVPFAMYSQDGIGADAIIGVYNFCPIAPAQLLLWSEGRTSFPLEDKSISRLPAEIGLALLLGTLLLLLVYASAREKRDERMRCALLFALAGGATAWMTTTLFPWSYLHVLTRGMTQTIQFPWRLLTFVDVLLALAAAYGYTRYAGGRPDVAVIAALTLSAVIALPTLGAQTRLNSIIEYGQGAQTAITYPEYQLPGTDVEDIYDRTWHAEGDVTVTDYEKNGARVTAQIDAREDARLTLPMFGFRGYAAEVDGQRLDWTLGENNRLQVVIPAGTSGMLHVWFEGEVIWRVFDAISLVTLLALIGNALLRRRRVNRAQGGMTNT